MLLLALRRGGAQSWNSLYTRRWAYESIDFEKEGETDGGLGRAVSATGRTEPNLTSVEGFETFQSPGLGWLDRNVPRRGARVGVVRSLSTVLRDGR